MAILRRPLQTPADRVTVIVMKLLTRTAAVAAVAALAVLAAGCSGSDAGVRQVKAPSITTINKPPPYNDLIKVATTLLVVETPDSFHADMELFRWHRGKAVEVGHKRWGLPDLPPPGTEKVFTYEKVCEVGRYYTRWLVWGVSAGGEYGEFLKYWPFEPGSDGNKPPDFHHSKEIHKC